jgi:hypothetical protein
MRVSHDRLEICFYHITPRCDELSVHLYLYIHESCNVHTHTPKIYQNISVAWKLVASKMAGRNGRPVGGNFSPGHLHEWSSEGTGLL